MPEQAAAFSNVLGNSDFLSSVLQSLGGTDGVNAPLGIRHVLCIAVSCSDETKSPPVDISLTDVLSSNNIAPLLTSRPEIVSMLLPHLPPDLPVPPSAETLQRVIRYVIRFMMPFALRSLINKTCP